MFPLSVNYDSEHFGSKLVRNAQKSAFKKNIWRTFHGEFSYYHSRQTLKKAVVGKNFDVYEGYFGTIVRGV